MSHSGPLSSRAVGEGCLQHGIGPVQDLTQGRGDDDIRGAEGLPGRVNDLLGVLERQPRVGQLQDVIVIAILVDRIFDLLADQDRVRFPTELEGIVGGRRVSAGVDQSEEAAALVDSRIALTPLRRAWKGVVSPPPLPRKSTISR